MARKVLEEEANVRGDAHIAEAEGRVELQRAGLATWEPARPGMQLYEGDFLKTGPNGAADIVFAEGSRYKIKPDTLFEVHRTSTVTGAGGESNRRSEIKFIAGRVEIDTGEAGRSVVITDSATANIESGSSVGVDLDERKSVGVSTFEGSARLATVKGGVVTIRERERATASADGGIGGKQLLPEPPRALTPEDNTIFDVRAKAPIALAWSAIKDARRYHLQIARSRLFIPDSVMVDLPDRAKTTTLVRVEREGTYFWRVAAISGAALSSEWSSPRRFKVQPAEARRGTPPALEVQKPQVNGRIVIVTGRTEPGCSVTINGEPADPDTGGGFTKVLSMTAEGVNVIEVRAVDGAGNEAVRRESVAIRVY